MMLTEVISTYGEAGLAAVTGYAVVFFGIVLLMTVVSIMGKIMQATRKKDGSAPVQAAPSAAQLPTAPGTAGKLKLYNIGSQDCRDADGHCGRQDGQAHQ
ncbi:MAG: OadG family protein [Oscillospiraceae bacterium]